MNKGFTLVELLAVMVILGIVLVIAIPRISDVIDNSKLEAFIRSEERIINATKLYLADNRDKIPLEIGDTNEVTVTDLITEGLIEKIQDPNNKNNQCNGYVLVTKINNDYYDYTPHINCIDTERGSAEADGLVLHYKFDDFQEWTENLFNGDGSFVSSEGEHIGNPDLSNGNTTLLGGNWRVSTHYNNAIFSIEEGGLFGGNKAVWHHKNITGWKGLVSANVFTLQGGKTYTVSVWVRVNKGTSGNPSAYAFYGPEGYRYWIQWDKPPRDYPGEWIRGTTTFTPNQTVSGRPYLYGISSGEDGLIVEYDGYQVEEKTYATPFTNGIRGGLVKDHSINENHANLNSNMTPRWLYDEEKKSGMYSFNNEIITFGTGNTFFPLNNFSISAWIKTPGLGNGMSINGIISITYGLTVYLNSSGNLNFRMDNGTALPAISVTKPLYDNKFHHIVVSFDGANQKMYIDGELLRTSPFSGWTGYTRWPTNIAAIGQENNNGSIHRFNGLIDDVRIYDRALSDAEIEKMYELDLHRKK